MNQKPALDSLFKSLFDNHQRESRSTSICRKVKYRVQYRVYTATVVVVICMFIKIIAVKDQEFELLSFGTFLYKLFQAISVA